MIYYVYLSTRVLLLLMCRERTRWYGMYKSSTLTHFLRTRQPHMGMTIPNCWFYREFACSLLGGIPAVHGQPQGPIFDALVHLQLAKLRWKWLVIARWSPFPLGLDKPEALPIPPIPCLGHPRVFQSHQGLSSLRNQIKHLQRASWAYHSSLRWPDIREIQQIVRQCQNLKTAARTNMNQHCAYDFISSRSCSRPKVRLNDGL